MNSRKSQLISLTPCNRRGFGFSLIEVVMALGIISFAMLSIIGLLPVGLNTFKIAMDQTVEGQIIQRINGEVMLTPFKQLSTTYGNKTMLFDMEGQPVTNPIDVRYSVRTSLGSTVYPGWTNAIYPDTAEAADAVSRNVQGIKVEIVRMPGSTATNTFNIQVPNSGT